jgi:hypothetical protein
LVRFSWAQKSQNQSVWLGESGYQRQYLPILGNAPAFGVVNYTEVKLSKKDFLSLRPVDYIVDFKGERSGFATTMASWTAGVTHRFNELVSVRPEVRYEHAFSARPWDNGQRKDQFMFAIDALLRF